MSIIKINNLGKCYRIGLHQHKRTYKNKLSKALNIPFEYLKDTLRQPTEEELFWALKDVSFDVDEGEVIGVIGRNGAGKSTLLKVLSRITEPTTGNAEINGRIASLLEVGTGFHPDLTGRENVFLNGSLLGMSKQEIKSQFDEIVDFSGVEKFIDTPVKKYSSGMHVRLGFAVAAHLRPEILIIDEVLAVGDAEFQKKCLGKMKDVSTKGRTVLFVSHNMDSVQNICNRGVYLKDGEINYIGEINDTIKEYLRVPGSNASGYNEFIQNQKSIIKSIGLKKDFNDNEYSDIFSCGDDIHIEIGYNTQGKVLDYASIGINTNMGQRVTTIGTHLDPNWNKELKGEGILRCTIPKVKLSSGNYQIQVSIGNKNPYKDYDLIENSIEFTIQDNNYFRTGKSLLNGQGVFVQKSIWGN